MALTAGDPLIERVLSVAWVLIDVDDVRSDLSAIHRIDDMDALSARRFWPLVERLAFYGGVVAAKFRYQHAQSTPESGHAPQATPVVTADNADDVLANPLYGDVPGLAAVFSYSQVGGEVTDG